MLNGKTTIENLKLTIKKKSFYFLMQSLKDL